MSNFIFTRENISKRVIIVRMQAHIEKICSDLQVYMENVKLKTFPMIVYEGQIKNIEISEIEPDNLDKLKRENLHGRSVWEFDSIISGLADKMEKK